MASILVIEDDEMVRELLQEILTRAGYDVTEASDGEVGIRLYRKKQPDVVITDLIMPNKEGIETIMELRRDFPDVKIIAIAGGGHASPTRYLKMAEQLGAQRTLAKPFLPKQILDAVQEPLEQQ